MFSKTCEYAIRALIFIAQKTKENQKTGIKSIAAGIEAPEQFIAKILHELGKKGLVQSHKGPSGGFYLNHVSLQNSLADIVKAVDGERIFSGCALGLSLCSEQKPCPIHHEFKKVRKMINDLLQNTTLGTWQEQPENSLFFLNSSVTLNN